jgi:hypothetical protein
MDILVVGNANKPCDFITRPLRHDCESTTPTMNMTGKWSPLHANQLRREPPPPNIGSLSSHVVCTTLTVRRIANFASEWQSHYSLWIVMKVSETNWLISYLAQECRDTYSKPVTVLNSQ